MNVDVVREDLVGSAYGTITAIQNCGLTLFPLFVASVYDIQGKYIPNVELLFALFGFCGTLIGLAINVLDRRNGNVLNFSGTTTAVADDDLKAPFLSNDDDHSI